MSKITRILAMVLCAVLLCTALVGCASGPQDGTYTARYENASHGYIEYLTVTFKDGTPVEAEYDAYAEGDPSAKKSACTESCEKSEYSAQGIFNTHCHGTLLGKNVIVNKIDNATVDPCHCKGVKAGVD